MLVYIPIISVPRPISYNAIIDIINKDVVILSCHSKKICQDKSIKKLVIKVHTYKHSNFLKEKFCVFWFYKTIYTQTMLFMHRRKLNKLLGTEVELCEQWVSIFFFFNIWGQFYF